jgi:hypothetical protein
MDPHNWWVSRLLREECVLKDTLIDNFMRNYEAYQHRLESQAIVSPRQQIENGKHREPFPVREKRRDPCVVLAEAEEYMDWVVRTPNAGVPIQQRSYVPRAWQFRMAYVFWLNEQGYRFLYTEPNHRRPAERFAAYLQSRPKYCSTLGKTETQVLRPPGDLIDNRLLRLRHCEKIN